MHWLEVLGPALISGDSGGSAGESCGGGGGPVPVDLVFYDAEELREVVGSWVVWFVVAFDGCWVVG